MSSQLVEPRSESPSDDSRVIPVKMPRDSGKKKGAQKPTNVDKYEKLCNISSK